MACSSSGANAYCMHKSVCIWQNSKQRRVLFLSMRNDKKQPCLFRLHAIIYSEINLNCSVGTARAIWFTLDLEMFFKRYIILIFLLSFRDFQGLNMKKPSGPLLLPCRFFFVYMWVVQSYAHAFPQLICSCLETFRIFIIHDWNNDSKEYWTPQR